MSVMLSAQSAPQVKLPVEVEHSHGRAGAWPGEETVLLEIMDELRGKVHSGLRLLRGRPEVP